MSKRLVLFLVVFTSLGAFAKESRILEVDPYNVTSIEKLFPNAVQTETMVDTGPRETRDYQKKIGPKTKQEKTVDYEALIPALIETIQDQQKEIAKLREGK